MLQSYTHTRARARTHSVTLVFHDPYIMGLAFHAIEKSMKLVTVKNKHKQSTYTQPPDLHLIVDFDQGISCVKYL